MLDNISIAYIKLVEASHLTESTDDNLIENFSKKWKDSGVDNFVSHRKSYNQIYLSHVKVPVDHQRRGVGSLFMRDLTQHADHIGASIVLTPSSDFGASKSRLIKFYKNHGFVENKGRNKDYTISETMYRKPASKKEMTLIEPEKLSEPTKSLPPVKSNVIPKSSLPDAFHKWFGDSKVSVHGNPIEVYHGTPDVTGIHSSGEFRHNPAGIFFTNDPTTANSYADAKRAFDFQTAQPGIISAHLRMNNPLVHDHGGKEWSGTREIIASAKEQGHDGVIINNVIDRYNTPATKKVKPSTVYVVFNPNQVKHSRMNSGQYSQTNKIFE